MTERRYMSDPDALASMTVDTPIEVGTMRREMRQLSVPFARVLYLGDLSRIGEVTAPELFGSGWVRFGRKAPEFQPPHRGAAQRRPLEDRAISRSQLDMMWDRDEGAFRVRPVAEARRRLCVVDLDSEEGVGMWEVVEETLLRPGTLLAIGQRALLLLCYAPWRSRSHGRMGLVGETEPIWRLRGEIAAMAMFKRPALVLGETGSGKELVARALRAQSPRAEGPFVATNCAAIPEQLVESELFGHAKGAFTGASQRTIGLFQQADGGTLFLDELGELPVTLQAKLLRVIQDGLVTPVGSHESVSVDVRLVAATNRDPEDEIEAGRLRNDLYYRISAHVIWVPTLAQRRWDVPLLLVHFLERLREEHPELGWLWADPRDTVANPVPMAFITGLLRHHWPGNVRELENVAEQVARLNLQRGRFQVPRGAWSRGDAPRGGAAPLAPSVPTASVPSHAPPLTSSALARAGHEARLSEACQELGVALKTAQKLLTRAEQASVVLGRVEASRWAEALQEQLTQNLFELLMEHDFHLSQTAADLEISRTTLSRLMRLFGLPRPQDLDEALLRRAYQEAGGDLDAVALRLRVSPQGLKSYVAKTGLLDDPG